MEAAGVLSVAFGLYEHLSLLLDPHILTTSLTSQWTSSTCFSSRFLQSHKWPHKDTIPSPPKAGPSLLSPFCLSILHNTIRDITTTRRCIMRGRSPFHTLFRPAGTYLCTGTNNLESLR